MIQKLKGGKGNMEVKKVTEIQKIMSLNELKPIKSEVMDLKQFHNRQVKLERATIVQVPSTFTALVQGSTTEHIPQWVLKVESEVLASIGDEDDKIEFRCSELFNLVQTEDGKLIGYPSNDKANLMKFMKDIRAQTPSEILGRMATAKAYEKKIIVDGRENIRTYLKFKY